MKLERHHLYTLALLAGAVAANVANLKTWSEARTPQFFAATVLTIVAVLKAMVQDSPGDKPTV
jgi:uncharacterized membrane protein